MNNNLDIVVARFLRLLCLIGGWLFLGLSVVTVLSALTRKYLNISVQGVDEYGGYILAIVVTVGFSYALIERAHIRIEILRGPLRPTAQAFFDMVAMVALLTATLLLVWVSSKVLLETIHYQALSNTPLRTPLIVPQSLWVGGLVMFALLCLMLTVRCSLALLRGDWGFVHQKLASESIEEEVSREVSSFHQRIKENDKDVSL
jgi:TRAP-type mannitol/chloroaromatic compound transport system permease small subunit